jgi:hypothetical protein
LLHGRLLLADFSLSRAAEIGQELSLIYKETLSLESQNVLATGPNVFS